MVDKKTKQELRQIWFERLVIGLFASTALGFFVARIPVVYSQMQTQMQTQKQALMQVQKAQTRQMQAQMQALVQAQKHELAQTQMQTQMQALMQVQKAQMRQMQAQMQALVQAQTRQALGQKQKYELAQKQKHELAQKQKHELAQALLQAQEQARALQHQFILLGISALCFIVMLLLLLRRNQIDLCLTYQLIIVLPEECIVELEAFHQQIKFEKRSAWVIRMIMLWTVLELLWALHIQINVENLWLPKGKGHNKIDD